MEIIENQSNKIEQLSDHVVDYLDTRWDLLVLGLTNKSSRVIARLASSVIMGIIGLLMLIFLSIATALWLGRLLDNTVGGFLALSSFYGVLLLLIWAFARTMIRNAIITNIIQSLNDPDDNDQNN